LLRKSPKRFWVNRFPQLGFLSACFEDFLDDDRLVVRFVLRAVNQRQVAAARDLTKFSQHRFRFRAFEFSAVTFAEFLPAFRIVPEELPQFIARPQLAHPFLDVRLFLFETAGPQPIDQNPGAVIAARKDQIWSRHEVDIYKAVGEGLPRDVEELRAAISDQDLWEQEYELKWLDEASAWLPYDLIFACEDADAGDPGKYQGGLVYVGNDIAARRDLWVAWVLELVGDVLWTREVRVLRRASFAEQDAVLDEIMRRYRVSRLWMDQTGMGEKPVEDAKRRYGASRVEGLLFTNAAKLDIATAPRSRSTRKSRARWRRSARSRNIPITRNAAAASVPTSKKLLKCRRPGGLIRC
jgi:hypothetical protein